MAELVQRSHCVRGVSTPMNLPLDSPVAGGSISPRVRDHLAERAIHVAYVLGEVTQMDLVLLPVELVEDEPIGVPGTEVVGEPGVDRVPLLLSQRLLELVIGNVSRERHGCRVDAREDLAEPLDEFSGRQVVSLDQRAELACEAEKLLHACGRQVRRSIAAS